MIRRLTKVQLVLFLVITLVGAAYLGGRYAEVDRLVVDRTYPVTMQLAESGGIFAGAQVTYRGIGVGRVDDLEFNDDGVEVALDIENSSKKIPRDVKAIVTDKSVVGEQYVDLKPQSQGGPYLAAGDSIAQENTETPLPIEDVLTDATELVSSVPTDDLQSVVDELGDAFEGTGPDLARVLDTSSEFVEAAHENIDVTRSLIRDSDTVLQTQIDKGDAIKSFADDLDKLSDTLVSSDPDVRRLLDEGGDSAGLIDDVLQENDENLTELLNNAITTLEPIADDPGKLQALYVLYPYAALGGFSVLTPDDPDKGEEGVFDASKYDYNAAFGLILNPDPSTCGEGYIPTEDWRPPKDRTDAPFDVDIDCTNKDKVARNPDKSKVEHDDGSSTDGWQRPAAGGYPTITGKGKDSVEWLMLLPAADD